MYFTLVYASSGTITFAMETFHGTLWYSLVLVGTRRYPLVLSSTLSCSGQSLRQLVKNNNTQ